MFKILRVLVISVLFAIILTGAAYGGVLATAKSWLTGEVIALFASGILAVLAGVFGLMFKKITRILKEAGEFMTTLGTAIEDNRVTREELAGIVKEGRDIFEVWK